NVVPHVEFGLNNGKLGIVMELAPGKTRWGTQKTELGGSFGKKLVALNEAGNKKGGAEKTKFDKYLRDLRNQIGGKIVFDGNKAFVEKTIPNPVDYKNPNVRRELIKLQWLDGINAQGDRHGGNYLVHVDENGNAVVTGI